MSRVSTKFKRNVGLFVGLGMLFGFLTYLYARYVETKRYRLEIERVTIGSGNGKMLRILHISDLHLCHPESDKVAFLQKITAEDYDLVFLTGDIFEDYTGLAYAGSILAKKPRLGAYAVLGNHDYHEYNLFHKIVGRFNRRFRHPPNKRDVAPLVKALEQNGFTVLRNSAVSLPDEKIHIIGIDYPGIEEEKLQKLARQAKPGHAILTLFHIPNNLDYISRAGVDLAVGGHTHGGQIRIPGFGAIITDSEAPRKHASGIFKSGKTTFHVSRGLGADPRTNFRLFCPPAATILEVSTN